jgi:hypothetical protein
VAAPERFSILASLPPLGGFRRMLALDRAGVARAVVLSFAPPAVADDPARLAAVLRDAEAAARLHHPAAAQVLGTETIDGELAVVELHRPGATLRALLDAGGRLPADVAARALLDACAAVARAHAVDAGDGRRLVHGAITAGRIVVGEDGGAFVCGLGLAGGGEPAADVRALGAVLFECVAGEPPGEPPRRLDVPGDAAALASAVDRATGAAGEPFSSAETFAAAIAAALPPADHGAVAAYADAILPRDEGERSELRRTLASALGAGDALEVSAELVVEPTDPGVAAPAPPAPASGRTGPPRTPDVVGTFPRPLKPARASRLPLAVAALCLAAGFAIGRAAARAPGALPVVLALRGLAASADTIPEAVPSNAVEPASVRADVPSAVPADAGPPDVEARPDEAAPRPPLAPAPRKGARGERPARAPRPQDGAGRGKLDVTAPPDAEVFLDGRRVGRGNVRMNVAEGPHRIEVRRGGASASEQFTLDPGETWTYTVTPAE